MPAKNLGAMILTAFLAAWSGCATPAPGATEVGTSEAADLSAPVWQPGDWWHYEAQDGLWQNWTVEAVHEDRNGFQAYRVALNYSRPSASLGTRLYTTWLDEATLGIVGMEAGPYRIDMKACGTGPVFPAVNQTWSCDYTINGFNQTSDTRKELRGWDAQQTPAGAFHALEVVFISNEGNVTNQRSWYSPEVGNWVRISKSGDDFGVQNPDFVLQAWGRADGLALSS